MGAMESCTTESSIDVLSVGVKSGADYMQREGDILARSRPPVPHLFVCVGRCLGRP